MIESALHESLKRLKTDYIDLYQLHWPERNTNFFGRLDYKHKKDERTWNNFESILKVLKKFIDQGKIRYIGLSNETSWGFTKFLQIAEEQKLPRIVSVQNPYKLVKDVRTSHETGNIDSVLNGDIGPFLKAYLMKK